jgi:hypothetical protein
MHAKTVWGSLVNPFKVIEEYERALKRSHSSKN